ncbi:MAG: DUF1080 domain-containing protein [Planctomycetota bacterium]
MNQVIALAFFMTISIGSFGAETQSLFNGTDLTGWTQATGSASYEVEPGLNGAPASILGKTIQNDSVNSFLVTEDTYSDFILEYEFKVDSNLNSGVQFRSFINSNNRVQGYQSEIDPSSRAWSGGLFEEQGRGWLNDLSNNAAARSAFVANEWNHIKIRAEGTHIQTWINGVQAVDYVEKNPAIPTEGFIGLQVHTEPQADLEVRWRNLNLIQIPEPSSLVLLSLGGLLITRRRRG